MNNPSRRRGVALIIVIFIFALLVAAISYAAQANLAARQESRRAAARAQAEYLAISGADLAQARLRDDASYAGETWNVPAVELGGRDAGLVTINVATDANDSAARRITVVAEYPAGTELSIHRYRLTLPWRTATATGTMP